MNVKKKRLTLELTPEERERLKATTTRKGVSMGQYCRAAIEDALAKDAAGNSAPKLSIQEIIARQKRVYGDRVLPGSSVDLINEAREERDRHMDSW